MHSERFGQYLVKVPIASGPLTEVYRGVQETVGREVAIKALKPSISPSSPFAITLTREAKVLAGLRHENIPRLIDFGTSDESIWLVMELIDGFTLREVLDRAKQLESSAAVAVALEVGRALSHAHARGIVHCDVRPENIVISKQGAVTLVDFSSCQAEHLPSTPEPLVGETTLAVPAYMSPEQVLGEPVEPRSDLFLLGIVLYEMLSGAKPFEEREDHTVAHSIRHDEPAALDARCPGVSRVLAHLVAKCLQKMPGDRFGSARELCAALEELLPKLTALPRKHVIAVVLARSRLIDRPPPIDDRDKPELLGSDRSVPSVGPVLRVHLLMLALVVLGGAVIQLGLRSDAESRSASGRGPLELVPDKEGSLRVLARPWAHVTIDGQHVETTPFAAAIPLSAGVHHVTLHHPQAPDERRVVSIAAGEQVLLDVTMRVKRPAEPDAGPSAAPSASTP